MVDLKVGSYKRSVERPQARWSDDLHKAIGRSRMRKAKNGTTFWQRPAVDCDKLIMMMMMVINIEKEDIVSLKFKLLLKLWKLVTDGPFSLLNSSNLVIQMAIGF